ncbi:hypothetical protein G9C85_16380 [Halorubellus sp. JP-L1]|uniref:hypothetical protein n=1 Tax=Halorubellus sp. JP-L1 TaxID=2715753 RepID=UPI00140D22E8|nr:hypothetical protein [Halorubellus sp. JP-L1]NHN43195.1 hypothetical protein [Halorubellus sp. JP-L1]
MTGGFGDGDEETLDDALIALHDPARRALLYSLADDSTVPVDPDAVLDDGEGPPSFDEISLRHRHLPKLEAAGLASYVEDDEVVERTERFEELRPLVESLREYECGDDGR